MRRREITANVAVFIGAVIGLAAAFLVGGPALVLFFRAFGRLMDKAMDYPMNW